MRKKCGIELWARLNMFKHMHLHIHMYICEQIHTHTHLFFIDPLIAPMDKDIHQESKGPRKIQG